MSEAEEFARDCEQMAGLHSNPDLARCWLDRAALIRRLEKERDEARNKALEEAAQVAANLLRFKSCASHNPVQEAILALKSKEPKP